MGCILAAAPAPADAQTAGRVPSVESLLAYESRLLTQIDDRVRPAVEERFGADPFKILHLPAHDRFLVLLRNRSEVLLADESLNPLDRQPAPKSPAGWSLVDDRYLFVGGEHAAEVYLYEVTPKALRLRHRLALENAVSTRDLVYVSAWRSLFLVDAFDRRLHQWTFPAGWRPGESPDFRRQSFPLGAGPIQIRHVDNHLLINLLLEHSLVILPLKQGAPDFSAASRIVHDGPIWAFDAAVRDRSLVIAAGGVEDRPLNRLAGEFGNIDSFLFLYRVPKEREGNFYRWRPEYRRKSDRFWQENLSARGVVTPKALRFAASSGGGLSLWIAAFGSDRVAHFHLRRNKPRLLGTFALPPGSTDLVVEQKRDEDWAVLLTNSLFDRVYRLERAQWSAVPGIPADPPKLSAASRLGELLFFTTLMTPHNSSDGELSRFTCEACHYEGGIDGRVHYTGRQHVFATTKPLRGLANNLPLFSRAGDKSLASMVLAEFRAANQKRRDDFSVTVSQFPWLKEIDGVPAVLSPTDLREALLAFFIDYEHRLNPLRLRKRRLSPKALQGLELFRERCEHCHQARMSTRADEALPYQKWREQLEGESGDPVWAAPFYTKTGILPYVHRAGARVPSLRRVWEKYPYFTNGSARTMRDLLARFRYRGLSAWHHYESASADAESGAVQALTAEEVSLLEELLRYF